MTPGQRKAARRPGVGGKKVGQWHNFWKKKQREVRAADRKRKPHSEETKRKIGRALRRKGGRRSAGAKASRR